jgi:proline iminopeptidase
LQKWYKNQDAVILILIGHNCTFDSMDIHSWGEGSVNVMLVPGGPGLVSEFYRELIDSLALHHRVSCVSFSGTAPQPPEVFPATIEAGAAELAAALGEVDTGAPCIILGHSYGAAVAIEYLLSGAPARCAGAILISGFPSGAFIASEIRARMADLPADFHHAVADGALKDGEQSMQLLMNHWLPKHFCRTEWPASFYQGLEQLNPHFMGHVLGPSLFEPTGSIQGWNREADLGSISVPLLVLGGAHDYYGEDSVRSLPWRTDALAPRIASSSTSSHSVWVEDPAMAYSEIEGFIERLGATPGA